MLDPVHIIPAWIDKICCNDIDLIGTMFNAIKDRLRKWAVIAAKLVILPALIVLRAEYRG